MSEPRWLLLELHVKRANKMTKRRAFDFPLLNRSSGQRGGRLAQTYSQ